jgi:hypothetical protein
MDNVIRIYEIDGIIYQPIGWFGCQIESIEWKKPKISYDNKRELLGYKFVPVNVESVKFFKWRINWCLEDVMCNCKDINEQNSLIREFLNKLRNPY